MNRAHQMQLFNDDFNSGGALMKKQLIREISCLERHLQRLRSRDELLDSGTLQTYEDMISSRKQMLDNLLWDD